MGGVLFQGDGRGKSVPRRLLCYFIYFKKLFHAFFPRRTQDYTNKNVILKMLKPEIKIKFNIISRIQLSSVKERGQTTYWKFYEQVIC